MSDTFTSYGYTFQCKILSALLSDKIFIQQVNDIIRPEYFESGAHQWITKYIIKYYSEYHTIPTLEVFKVYMQQIDSALLKDTVIAVLKDAFLYIDAPDLSFIKTEIVSFCKNQVLKTAILESVDLLNSGDYDGIKSVIDDAMKVGIDKNIGHNYKEDIIQRYEETSRNVIKTPWPSINDIADGGFGKGELIVCVARPGEGKCVGPNTKIEIEYDEIGLEFTNANGGNSTMWIKPWDIFNIDNNIIYGYQIPYIFNILDQVQVSVYDD